MNIPASIDELHSFLRNRDFTLPELVDSYTSRINSHKELNAFITVTDDYAYDRAKALQKIIDNNPNAFDELPLLGVPVAVKDLFLTKGIRTTAASKVLESYIPAYSATVFEKLENAGAILVGKTNCDAWAHGASGENSDFGATLNPWNKEVVPGGSSSGSAVAVASDMSLVSMGTDTGGSIRQPASFCNVYGLKPTYGTVSRYGVIAMSSSLDTVGHFAKNINDTKKVFEATRGEDRKDSTLKNFDYGKHLAKDKPKIGLPKEYFTEGLHPEVKVKVMSVAKLLEKAGHMVIDVSLPHTEYAIAVYYIVQPAEVSSNLGRYDGVRFGNSRDTFGAEAKRRIMLGTYALSSGYYDEYYAKAMKVRTLIRRDFDSVFSEVDALLSPTSPSLPFRIGEKSTDPLQMYLSDIYTVSANLAGVCGLSVPAGFSESNLPIGAQFIAPRFGENVLFKLAKELEQQTDYHTRKPSI